MQTTFNNVTITIKAATAKEAYTKLAKLLSPENSVVCYETDTYEHYEAGKGSGDDMDDLNPVEANDVSELF